jgi:pyrroloquinoline quinone biosynthesis protein D
MYCVLPWHAIGGNSVGVLKKITSRFRKEKKVIPREDVLSAIPIRNPLIKWELEDAGEAKLTIPLRKSVKLTVLSFLFRVPKMKVVMLDDVGTQVWLKCDGNNRVEDLVKEMREKHNLSRREVEVSLFSYLQQLSQRGYIGLEMRRGKELLGEISPSK